LDQGQAPNSFHPIERRLKKALLVMEANEALEDPEDIPFAWIANLYGGIKSKNAEIIASKVKNRAAAGFVDLGQVFRQGKFFTELASFFGKLSLVF
jgi:hypothetical protein